MKNTKLGKLILAAAFLAAAPFSQNALAYGAVWQYGGNYGFGKGVGAVADYKTQAEADREAIKQCRKERPAYAARSKWGKCRISERFKDRCVSWGRYLIRAVTAEGFSHVKKDVSSYTNYFVEEDFDLTKPVWRWMAPDPNAGVEEQLVKMFTGDYSGAKGACHNFVFENRNMGSNVGPGVTDAPNFMHLETACLHPSDHGAVCDNAGYELVLHPEF